MKKEEFMRQIEDCRLPESFDQNLLDKASEMFSKWGMTTHMNEKEHLFETFGLASKRGDSADLKKEKELLRCVCEKMLKSDLNRHDASVIIKNFNRIRDPSFQWIEG